MVGKGGGRHAVPFVENALNDRFSIYLIVLQTKNILSNHDDILWNLIMNSAEPD